MDVDNRTAFVRGFLHRCAEEGLTKEAVAARIDAAARFKQAAFADTVGNLTGTALGLPVLAGLLGGGALGYAGAKLTEPDVDLNEIRAKEIANTYRVYAQRAAARKKTRGYRPPSSM